MSVYSAALGHSVERDVFRNGALATWVAGGEHHGGSVRPKRPRYWLVRADVWKRYLDEGVTPRQAREDECLGARAAVSKTAESTVAPRVEYDWVYLPLVAQLREKGYVGRTRKTSEPGTHRLLPLAYEDWLEAGRPNFAAGDQRRIKTGLAESCFELSEWCDEHDWRNENFSDTENLTCVGKPISKKRATKLHETRGEWRDWTRFFTWSFLVRKPLEQILRRDVLKDLERIGGEGDEGPADPPNA